MEFIGLEFKRFNIHAAGNPRTFTDLNTGLIGVEEYFDLNDIQ